jgi:hypothetical protein
MSTPLVLRTNAINDAQTMPCTETNTVSVIGRIQTRQLTMEPLWSPAGATRWQPVANGAQPTTAQTSENRCRGLPALAAEAPW